MSTPAHAFGIGLVQRACSPDAAANVRSALEGVREAASRGAQIVCLQEMFNNTYFCKTEDFARFDLAEPIDGPDAGPTITACRDAAKALNVAIIAPIFEKRAPGLYHNSAAVIDAGGELLGVYRKMTIPDDPLYYEKFYFTPGDADTPSPDSLGTKVAAASGYRVFRTRFARVGVLICWDQWYPENARITTLLGAEALFYPTAIGWHPREKAAHGTVQADAWRTIQRGHAIANELFVAAVNRTGFEPEPGADGIEFFGGSFIADPAGQVVAEAPVSEEAVLIHQCDRRAIEERRRHWPFLRDRRVDAFAPITRRWLT